MKEPTEEEIRRFWEWCGFGIVKAKDYEPDWISSYSEFQFGWRYPDGSLKSDLPSLEGVEALGNLFKYAVPKVLRLGYAPYIHPIRRGWCANVTWLEWLVGKRRDRVTNSKFEVVDKDPALALFWAIMGVISDEDR